MWIHVSKLVCTAELHHAHGDVLPFSVPSGFDFKAAGGSAVRYCLSDYLL